jgi:protein-disulfide isomerase
MVPKKKSSNKSLAKRVSAKNVVEEIEMTSFNKETAPTSLSPINRLNKMVSLMAVLMVVLFVFQGYLFYQLTQIGVKGAATEVESPLSEENLKKYAKELKLDMGKFNKCYTSDVAKNRVSADAKEAQSLNISGTPGFLINGKFLGGAFPIETFREIIDKELAGTSSINCTDYSQDLQRYCSDPQNIAFIPNPVQVKVGAAPILGPKTAPVIIVEYSDFECPFCARAYQTVNEIKKEYGDKVAIAYKQLPLSFHKNAEPAARASVCAQEQGKFWEYHDKLFDVQKQ